MDKPIEVGTVVQVVRQHCGQADSGGMIGAVSAISHGTWECSFCYGRVSGAMAQLPCVDNRHAGVGWLPVAYLKPWNPPALPEHTETTEGITACIT